MLGRFAIGGPDDRGCRQRVVYMDGRAVEELGVDGWYTLEERFGFGIDDWGQTTVVVVRMRCRSLRHGGIFFAVDIRLGERWTGRVWTMG